LGWTKGKGKAGAKVRQEFAAKKCDKKTQNFKSVKMIINYGG
jgi:hypothetical protein